MKKETHLTLRFLAEGIKMLFTSAGHREGRTDYFLCLCLSSGDSQQPQTTTWNSNTDSINTTCSCFLSCTSSSLASLSASSWRRLSCKNNFSSWTCYCVRRQENATTNLGDEEFWTVCWRLQHWRLAFRTLNYFMQGWWCLHDTLQGIGVILFCFCFINFIGLSLSK